MVSKNETDRLLEALASHDPEDLAHAILCSLAVAGVAPTWDSGLIGAILTPLAELEPTMIDPGSPRACAAWEPIADRLGIDYRRDGEE